MATSRGSESRNPDLGQKLTTNRFVRTYLLTNDTSLAMDAGIAGEEDAEGCNCKHVYGREAADDRSRW